MPRPEGTGDTVAPRIPGRESAREQGPYNRISSGGEVHPKPENNPKLADAEKKCPILCHTAFIPPANAGKVRDAVLIPGSGRCPGGGHGNPLQYFCLENPMEKKSLPGYSP